MTRIAPSRLGTAISCPTRSSTVAASTCPVSCSATDAARVATYAFLTGLVERYGGAGDFGSGALDLELALDSAALGAALAAEFLVAP
jgi:hypothetical protein